MCSENRDFKGVWIPKEIWLNTELTALDKVIYTEISSLDNPKTHCTASNEYLADFCMCSERKVTDTIKKLTEMGLIETVKFDGRHRTLKIVSGESRKNCDADQKNLQSININNNIKNNISKDILLQNSEDDVSDKLYSEEKPKKRKSLFDKCVDEIYANTDDLELEDLLVTYLKMRLEVKDKPLYYNMWKGMLNKLFSMSYNLDVLCKIVQQSIDKGWLAFYELTDSKKKNPQIVSSEFNNVNCDKLEYEEIISDVRF